MTNFLSANLLIQDITPNGKFIIRHPEGKIVNSVIAKKLHFPCMYLDCSHELTLDNIEEHFEKSHKVTKIKIG